MQIIGCQTDICWHDKPANFAAVRALLAGARAAPPALIVLPEMFATGFSMQVTDIAETADGPTNRFLAELAAEHRSYVIGGVVGMAPGDGNAGREASEGRGRNQAAVFDPSGKQAARYDKLHPFSFAGENEYYSGGQDVVLFDCGPWRVAPLVCYDLRFPEVFRRAARLGANLLVVIANWPAPRVAHWTQLLIARAIENQAYVVGVNRAGHDPKLAYPGRSLIVDPRGQVVVELDEQPGLMTATLDLAALEEYRRQFPALADIRPEFLGME
jgi:predicted amidohydrolase